SYSDDGELWVIADTSGFWNLYTVPSEGGALEPQVTTPHDIGEPAWVFGQSSYAVSPTGVTCVVSRDGRDQLARADRPDRDLVPATGTEGLPSFGGVRRGGPLIACVAAGPAREAEIVTFVEPPTGAGFPPPQRVRPARELGVDPDWFSTPTHLTFPTTGGAE